MAPTSYRQVLGERISPGPLRGTHGPDLTTQGLLAAAESGDSGARRVLADAGRHIGTAVATLCDLLNPS